jgi:hypothetical protein
MSLLDQLDIKKIKATIIGGLNHPTGSGFSMTDWWLACSLFATSIALSSTLSPASGNLKPPDDLIVTSLGSSISFPSTIG